MVGDFDFTLVPLVNKYVRRKWKLLYCDGCFNQFFSQFMLLHTQSAMRSIVATIMQKFVIPNATQTIG